MLEPILKGLVEWIYEMMVDIMAYASGELIDVMSMDLAYFEETAPVISEIVNVFVALGWALLMGNLVFQCIKVMMSGAGFEAEDPKILFLRTFVFSFLLLVSREICEIGLSITGTVIDMLNIPSSIEVNAPGESLFSFSSDAKWLLVIIVGVILMVQMVKLLFEIGERYVITSVLTFFAPLAFSMGGSKNTNDIFKGWVRMYCSMLVMMIMNIVFLKLIMSAMSRMTTGGVLVWLVFVVALTRVARKIDSHIGKIGLNPAQTGSELGSRLPGIMTMVAVRTMGSLISKSAANAKGGNGGKSGRNGRGGSHERSRNPRPFSPISGGGYTSPSSSASGTAPASTMPCSTETHTATKTTAPSTLVSPSVPASKGMSAGNQMHQTVTPQGGQAPSINTGKTLPTTRPLLPRNTAGKQPQGANPITSVTEGPVTMQGKTNVIPANSGVHKNIPNVKGSIPVTAPPVMQDGNQTSVDTDTLQSSHNFKGSKMQGGNILGGDKGGVHIVGGSIGGNTQIHSTHTTSTHSATNSSEHFSDNETTTLRQKYAKAQRAESRINHEYAHGRFNPAAANKKVKKSYYEKGNPLSQGHGNEPIKKGKRGGNNRKQHKQ